MSRMSKNQRGAVSIFVVVFTALLITIVTVSFARLMLRDLQRASNNDLSQSAQDAALAGVEDAKRALAALPEDGELPDLRSCNAIATVLGKAVEDSENSEVRVGDNALQQAYTCVSVELKTDDYIGTLAADQVHMVPLKADGGRFDTVRVEWFSKEDMSGTGDVDLPGSGPTSDLPAPSGWPQNRPAVLETQLIQTDRTFRLSQFDDKDDPNDGQSNTNTLFLYPKQRTNEENHTPTSLRFMNDVRRSSTNDLSTVRCARSVASELYSCSTDISLPLPIDGGVASRSNAYLRLTARYNASHYRISMWQGGSLVQFNGVQPEVDSTGRASDLFRRVSARIETASNVVYPGAAVDIHGNFCKTFRVTDRLQDYDAGACTP